MQRRRHREAVGNSQAANCHGVGRQHRSGANAADESRLSEIGGVPAALVSKSNHDGVWKNSLTDPGQRWRYPPDVVIEIPRNVCGTLEFDRADEMISIGYRMAAEKLT